LSVLPITSRKLSAEELATCVTRVVESFPEAGMRLHREAHGWVIDHAQPMYWVCDRDPADLLLGEVYTTFLLQGPPETAAVVRFRSRRKDGGDETLP
jgi:hypothetical protein